ncbi:BTB/POZ domain-containing protein 18 [Ctenodactylus gundi]
MYSAASSKILYRNPRLLRLAFLQLHHQQQSGVFCDVLLQAEGETVPAHCCVLSACSPFFTERLEQERPAQGQKVVLELGGLKIKTLRKLVDFLYTSEMEVSHDEAQDVLSAARQLRVAELEYLQLEGGKLVKASQSRRLNRGCLQQSAAPISAKVVAPSHHPRTPLPGSETPCPTAAVRLKSLGKEEGPLNNSCQAHAETLPGTVLLKRKARACLAPQNNSSSPSHSQEPTDKGPALGPAALSLPSLSPLEDKQLLPRKIRLSRSKPPPATCPVRPPDTHSGPSSAGPAVPGRRLWRQRNLNSAVPEVKQESRITSPRHSTQSPSVLGKAGGSRKRSPEVKAPHPEVPEGGQVGRVKLRKMVNGTCWEVVQEPPHQTSRGSPQIPELRTLLEEPPGTEQNMSRGKLELFQDSPEGAKPPDILLSSASTEVHRGKNKLGCSPELAGKKPRLSMDCKAPYMFDSTLLGQPCETDGYGISGPAATNELDDILDFMLHGSDAAPPAEGYRTPSHHLTDAGKNWVEEEEWCLPDMDLWPGELTGLEKEPAAENETAEPLGTAPDISEGQGLSEGSWPHNFAVNSSQPLDGLGDDIPMDRPGPTTESHGTLSPPCSFWGENRLGLTLTFPEVLYPTSEATKEVCNSSELLGSLPASSEDEEIDVVDREEVGKQVSKGVPSVWPDPSSESETELDILT